MQLETDRRGLQEATDALAAAERKIIMLQAEVNDLQAQLAAVYSNITATCSLSCYTPG